MKSTGVLRRIDDLGRIVIPKEIRKNLKIKDGESLEIFIEGDAVVLKKYSFMSDLYDISQTCSDSFYEIINKDIMITDRDKIISVAGNLKKKYIGKDISNFISNVIEKKKTTVDNDSGYIEIIDDEGETYKFVISSVIVDGDAVGSVIILSTEKISETEEKSAIFISKFLSKHLE